MDTPRQPPLPPTSPALRELWAALEAEPWRHDFFQTLRRIEALHPAWPRLGAALQPREEPLRIGQDPGLDFAPAALQSFGPQGGGGVAPPRLGQRFFGLFGSMGPMPLHLSEYVRERSRNHGDLALERFADMFHHRMALLFYRAWAQAQPSSQLDRPDDDAFSRWVGALCGLGQPGFAPRESLSSYARLQHAGTLAQGVRHAEGLEKILRHDFGVPIKLEQHVGQWLKLDDQERAELRPSSAVRRLALGRNVALGSKVWDRQYRVRLHIGPLSLAEYQRFLPGEPACVALGDWLRTTLGLGLSCEISLRLRESDIPPLQLGCGAGRVGRTAWLGQRRGEQPAQQKGQHPDRAGMTWVDPARQGRRTGRTP
jgi:type VI secretion system protein ImpH